MQPDNNHSPGLYPLKGVIFMKFSSLFLIFLFSAASLFAVQWEPITNYPATTSDAFSFTIDGEAYVGGGMSLATFHKYNKENDNWERLADFGGGNRAWAFSFVIDGKAYVGCGTPNASLTNLSKDLWEYDPATDTWTQKANFGGGEREGCFAFALNGKGYVGCGMANSVMYNDVWEYDPYADTWSEIESYPGQKNAFTFSFVIDGKAYVGGGGSFYSEFDDFYVFNPISSLSLWEKKADIPKLQGGVSFTVDGKGYIAGGTHFSQNKCYDNTYQYNPAADTWKEIPEMQLPNKNSVWSCAFVIDQTAYFGLGLNLQDFSLTNNFYSFDASQLPKEPLIQVDIPDISFPETDVGSSAEQIVEISNPGDKILSITDVSIENDEDGVFSADLHDLKTSLNAGEKTQLTVEFIPTDDKDYTAALIINSDAANAGDLEIPISGSGFQNYPEISVITSTIQFGKVEIHSSDEYLLKIENTGESDLEIKSVDLKNDIDNVFEIESYTFPVSIDPEKSKEFAIIFSPEEQKDYTCTVEINSNDPENPTIPIDIEGEGFIPSGVNDFSNDGKYAISVNPNPVSDNTILKIINNDVPCSVSYELCDITGRKIIGRSSIEIFVGENNIPIRINNLSTGCYVLMLKIGSTRESVIVNIK
jgi:N-acetylneuraminic acid mutarotase